MTDVTPETGVTGGNCKDGLAKTMADVVTKDGLAEELTVATWNIAAVRPHATRTPPRAAVPAWANHTTHRTRERTGAPCLWARRRAGPWGRSTTTRSSSGSRTTTPATTS